MEYFLREKSIFLQIHSGGFSWQNDIYSKYYNVLLLLIFQKKDLFNEIN